ncbi:MAG: toprim domain-containing protein [Rhodobiaceae bacterium]|nr:toprim domain-containing protein [Rhodobiaceae bacterium]
MRDDVPVVKQMLADRIDDLCRQLLPDGKRKGRLWTASNPVTRDHDHTPALTVALDRDIGAWKDYRSGDKGDILDLVTYCNRTDFKGAMAWARDWLGLRSMSSAERDALQQRADVRRAEQAKKTEKAQAFKAEWVRRIWDSASPDRALPAAMHAAAYLFGRDCPLDLVRHLDPETFRFHASLEWWPGAEWRRDENGRNRKMKDGPLLPAMVAAFRAPTGQLTAVHCTFLDPQRPAKAAVDKPKLMLGSVSAGMIRISSGAANTAPETDSAPGPVIVCEGIETGLSLAIAVPEARVWAAGSLGNMGNCPVDLACVGAVILARDADWASPQAMKQFDDVHARICAMGKPVTVMEPLAGGDFNDVIKGDDDGESDEERGAEG